METTLTAPSIRSTSALGAASRHAKGERPPAYAHNQPALIRARERCGLILTDTVLTQIGRNLTVGQQSYPVGINALWSFFPG